MPKAAATKAPLSAAAQALAADPRNRDLAARLAWRITHKLGRRDLYDEFHSAALFGLVGAAARYDPAQGVLFRTFAARLIQYAIADAVNGMRMAGFVPLRIRDGTPPPRVASLSAPVVLDGEPVELGELVPAAGDAVGWEEESLDEVRQLLGPLCWRSRQAIELYLTWADCTPLRVIGERMGVSASRVSQLISEGLAELRAIHCPPRKEPTDE